MYGGYGYGDLGAMPPPPPSGPAVFTHAPQCTPQPHWAHSSGGGGAWGSATPGTAPAPAPPGAYSVDPRVLELQQRPHSRDPRVAQLQCAAAGATVHDITSGGTGGDSSAGQPDVPAAAAACWNIGREWVTAAGSQADAAVGQPPYEHPGSYGAPWPQSYMQSWQHNTPDGPNGVVVAAPGPPPGGHHQYQHHHYDAQHRQHPQQQQQPSPHAGAREVYPPRHQPAAHQPYTAATQSPSSPRHTGGRTPQPYPPSGHGCGGPGLQTIARGPPHYEASQAQLNHISYGAPRHPQLGPHGTYGPYGVPPAAAAARQRGVLSSPQGKRPRSPTADETDPPRSGKAAALAAAAAASPSPAAAALAAAAASLAPAAAAQGGFPAAAAGTCKAANTKPQQTCVAAAKQPPPISTSRRPPPALDHPLAPLTFWTRALPRGLRPDLVTLRQTAAQGGSAASGHLVAAAAALGRRWQVHDGLPVLPGAPLPPPQPAAAAVPTQAEALQLSVAVGAAPVRQASFVPAQLMSPAEFGELPAEEASAGGKSVAGELAVTATMRAITTDTAIIAVDAAATGLQQPAPEPPPAEVAVPGAAAAAGEATPDTSTAPQQQPLNQTIGGNACASADLPVLGSAAAEAVEEESGSPRSLVASGTDVLPDGGDATAAATAVNTAAAAPPRYVAADGAAAAAGNDNNNSNSSCGVSGLELLHSSQPSLQPQQSAYQGPVAGVSATVSPSVQIVARRRAELLAALKQRKPRAAPVVAAAAAALAVAPMVETVPLVSVATEASEAEAAAPVIEAAARLPDAVPGATGSGAAAAGP